MPMVGILISLVINFAACEVMHSKTIANAPSFQLILLH